MKKNKHKDNKKKKYMVATAKFLSFFSIFVGVIAGLYFGLNYYINSEEYEEDSKYKNSYNIQIKIDQYDSSFDIDYVVQTFYDRLDFIGYSESKIEIIDDENLIISFPLDSTSKSEPFSFATQEEMFLEVLYIQTSLISRQNIEFRTLEGDQLFDLQDGAITFIPPPLPEEGDEEIYTTSSSYGFIDGVPYYELELISHAEVAYTSGAPYLLLTPSSYDV